MGFVAKMSKPCFKISVKVVFNLFWIALHKLILPTHGLWLGDCNKPLGLSSGEIPDAALTASSSHYPIVGPQRARLGREDGGGAWCPKEMVDQNQREYVQVDLPTKPPHLVTAVGTQGRYANNYGVEYTPAYTIEYAMDSSGHFLPYTRTIESNESILLIGNTDTFTEIRNELERPLIASKLRIKPFSFHPRVVCLRLELYGCAYTGKLDYYQIESREEKYAIGEGVLQDGIVIATFYDETDEVPERRRSRHSFVKKDWEFFIEEEDFKNLELLKAQNSSFSNGSLAKEDNGLEPLEPQDTLDIPSLPPGEIIAPDFPLNVSFTFTERLKFHFVHLYVDPIHPLIAGSKPVLKIIVDYEDPLSRGLKSHRNFTFDLTNKDFRNITLPCENLTSQVLHIHITADHAEVNLQETYFEADIIPSTVSNPILRDQTSLKKSMSPYMKKKLKIKNLPKPPKTIKPSFVQGDKSAEIHNPIMTLQGKDSLLSSSKLNLKRSSTVVWTVHAGPTHRTYVGIAIGFSIGVGLLLGIWIWLWARTSKRKISSPHMFRRPLPPDTLDMACLVEGPQTDLGLQSNQNVHPSPCEDQDYSSHFEDDSPKAPLVCPYPTLTVSTVSSLDKTTNTNDSLFQYYSFGKKSTKEKKSFFSSFSRSSYPRKKIFKPFQEGLSSTIFPSSIMPNSHQNEKGTASYLGAKKPKDTKPTTQSESGKESSQSLSFALQNDMFFNR